MTCLFDQKHFVHFFQQLAAFCGIVFLSGGCGLKEIILGHVFRLLTLNFPRKENVSENSEEKKVRTLFCLCFFSFFYFSLFLATKYLVSLNPCLLSCFSPAGSNEDKL